MCLMTALGVASSLIGSVIQAKAAKKESTQQTQVAQQQQAFDVKRAERESEIGVMQAARQRKETERMLAQQTALRAGTGGATSRGSALLISEDTAREGELSALLEESNAATRSQGIKTQSDINYAAAQSRAQATETRGKLGMTSGIFRAGSTLLQTGSAKKMFG